MAAHTPNYNFPRIRFCLRGHAIVGDNIIICRVPKGGRAVRCRACIRLRRNRMLDSGKVGEQKIRAVFEALGDGKTMAQITGRRGGRYIGGPIIDNSRLDAFCRVHPKIGKRIHDLSAKNVVAQREEAKRSRCIIVSRSIIRATDDIMDAIEAAVPHYLQKDHRDDVIQNIWLDVWRGKFPRAEIAARAPAYVSAEYRANHNKWGDRSLDVPIWIDSATTLLDTLSTEHALWGPR